MTVITIVVAVSRNLYNYSAISCADDYSVYLDPVFSFCSITIVNIACDRDDLVFMAVAPVARDAEPCSRQAAISSTELTLTSFKPFI